MKVNVDLKNIYNTYFKSPFQLEPKTPEELTTSFGFPLKETVNGHDVFLPIKLVNEGVELNIRCATIRVNSEKTIVRTLVAERKGTVKEQFSVGDYKFSIKGVLIAEGQGLPDIKMNEMKRMYESVKPVELHNAIADLFLDSTPNVVIESLEFPEVEGKAMRHRPFVMNCESDYVDKLTL